MIEVRELSKVYNYQKINEVKAVTEANMTIEEGEITTLIGPSGCGKTTLMSMIGLLLTPSKGKILFDGKEVSAYSDRWKSLYRRENFGYIFQHINLLPNLIAIDNVLLPLLSHDTFVESHREEAISLLNELGVSERIDFPVEQLSGGQQQRVAIARALITDPKIIIADEPLTFVDSKSADTITSYLRTLRDKGKTILISTHSRDLLEISDKTYSMNDGRIIDII